MFRLRQEHRDAFRQGAMERFEDVALASLRRSRPEQVRRLAADELRTRVRKALGRAAAYDLTTEFEVVKFVETSLLLGDRFDTDPQNLPVQMLLKDKNLEPLRKAEMLVEFAESIAASRALAAPKTVPQTP